MDQGFYSEPGDPQAVPTAGRIDIHSHLLPSIDDGCLDLSESFDCVTQLVDRGFVGSICTPHVYPRDHDCNDIESVRAMTVQLANELADAGVEYRLWPGGELRLYDGVIDWLKDHPVPTLADSRCVLVDFWVDGWPKWVMRTFEWLIEQGYQPILAHPERLGKLRDLDQSLADVAAMGVWLQGNLRCMTGEDGYYADQWVRKLLAEDRYQLMALDMHRPNSLDGRFDGMQFVEAEFGAEVLNRFTIDAPRKLILSTTESDKL